MQWLFLDAPGAKEEQGHDKLVKKSQRVEIEYQDGIVDQLLTPRSNNNLEVIHASYPPDTRSDPYSHKGHEAVLVLTGCLEVEISGERFVLEEGDCLTFASSEPHGHANLSKGVTTALWFITPASF